VTGSYINNSLSSAKFIQSLITFKDNPEWRVVKDLEGARELLQSTSYNSTRKTRKPTKSLLQDNQKCNIVMKRTVRSD
jgi:hypothetical protein